MTTHDPLQDILDALEKEEENRRIKRSNYIRFHTSGTGRCKRKREKIARRAQRGKR